MVPFEAFSTDAPQSSMAFCSGCVGGTQCDSLSSKVLSWASADEAMAMLAAPVTSAASRRPVRRDDIPSSLLPVRSASARFQNIEHQVHRVVKPDGWI